MAKRYVIQPTRPASLVGGILDTIGGLAFVGLGIFMAIPTFGAFGYVWTLIAGLITATSLFTAISGRVLGQQITEENAEPSASAGSSKTAAQRLQTLEELRAQGLITPEEYAARRAEILRKEA